MEDTSKLIQVRKDKVEEIREMGIEPYPYNYDVKKPVRRGKEQL